MLQYCKNCYKEKIDPQVKDEDLTYSQEEGTCECCGEIKHLVIIKEKDPNIMTVAECNVETQKHIEQVRKYIRFMTDKMTDRGINHDASKLSSPEVEAFAKYTKSLSQLEFGSDEYKKSLQALKPTLDHHYATNGDKYLLGVGGYDGKNIEDARTVQQVINSISTGMIEVVKDIDLIANTEIVEEIEKINYFTANIPANKFPVDFLTAHDKYNLIVKVYGSIEDPEYGNVTTLGYTASHFCYMFDKNPEEVYDTLQFMCYDQLDKDGGIYHSTSLNFNTGDTYELSYEGKMGEDTALPKEGSKVSIYLQKLY